jgi:hypothetical protein
MLHDPARHDPLRTIGWDEARARSLIERIVVDTETRFSGDDFWPLHPRDAYDGDKGPAYPLYHGAAASSGRCTICRRARRDAAPRLRPVARASCASATPRRSPRRATPRPTRRT